jgi:hypothetical protein
LFVERVMAKKTALMGRILRRKTRKWFWVTVWHLRSLFWVLTSCSLVRGHQRFGVTCCLHLLLYTTNGSKTRSFGSPYSSLGAPVSSEPCVSRFLQSYSTYVPNINIDPELLCSVLLHVLL